MSLPSSRRVRRAASVAALGLVAALALTGCSNDALADQYKSGSGKNYVAGDGSVTEIHPDDRADAVEFAGTTEDGTAFDSTEHAGEVLVVNFWYAGCAPCRAEAADLEAVNEEFDGKGATFVGVNVRDQAATASSFEQTYDVGYGSIIDANDGAVQLAFAGTVPPNAVPTTLVLDAKHRVAARVLGQLEDRSILETLVRDTIAETE
ncbi:TlpA disulfide reductase family protein [Rathayibacter sp. YIM 133350]|uniref:TlpA family protein disulfide reductase n=1 Tax=Rathayibacter sp. YIM 133350 TaxID=3131992 RepID=UPI00307D3927